VAGSSGASLRPHERLTRRADFRNVFSRGVRSDGRLLAVIALRNQLGWSRLGLTVGRRVGGAVARNRAKRLLRECFRRNKPPRELSLDVVVVAKNSIAGRGLDEVEAEFRRRLAQAGNARRRRHASPALDD
jgi:ribonuclease P protein component